MHDPNLDLGPHAKLRPHRRWCDLLLVSDQITERVFFARAFSRPVDDIRFLVLTLVIRAQERKRIVVYKLRDAIQTLLCLLHASAWGHSREGVDVRHGRVHRARGYG